MNSSLGVLERAAFYLRLLVNADGGQSAPGDSTRRFPMGRHVSAPVIVVATAALWLVTLPWSPAPTYDTQWQLLWGEQLSRGEMPDYGVGPTVHPLMVMLGGALSIVSLGNDAVVDQAVRAITALSFVSIAWLCAMVAYRVAGIAAALLLAVLVLSRPFVFEFAFVSYFDVIFVALCFGGVVAARGGRPAQALWLLTAAGLIRPEAWIFAAVVAGVGWWRGPRRMALIAVAIAAPVIWGCFDWVVAGDPLYSFTNTSAAAEGLGRDRGLVDAAVLAPVRAGQLVGVEVAALMVVGFALAWYHRHRVPEAAWLLTVSSIAFGSYFAVNSFGTSILSRYLLFPTLAAMPFVAFLIVELANRMREGHSSWLLPSALAVIVGSACAVTTALGIKEIAAGVPDGKRDARADNAVRAAARLLAGCRTVGTNDFYVVAMTARELDLSPEVVSLSADGRVQRPFRTELVGTGRRSTELRGGILVRGTCAHSPLNWAR